MANLKRRGDSAGTQDKKAAEKKPTESQEATSSRWSFRIIGVLVILVVFAALSAFVAVFGSRSTSDSTRPKKQSEVKVWVSSAQTLPSIAQKNVTCAEEAGGDGSGSLGHCGVMRKENRCARFVSDGAISVEHVQELRSLLSWLIHEAWGAGAGAPSVVDLHSEIISYKEAFVNLTELMQFKSLKFTPKQVEAYSAVRRQLRQLVAQQFGIDPESLQHDMTFFSHINGSKTAHTTHDEYWHSHIDTEQYGTFAYTSLLYLNTQDEDFHGGEFIFEATPNKKDTEVMAVEPKAGRVVLFSSDAENPHKVLNVSQGVRMALTAAFTCSKEQASSIEAFPPRANLVAE